MVEYVSVISFFHLAYIWFIVLCVTRCDRLRLAVSIINNHRITKSTKAARYYPPVFICEQISFYNISTILVELIATS